jgi:hypothetical protein
MKTIKNSPWGQVQHDNHIADGIVFVSTAGHGGFHLSPERHAAVRAKFPAFSTFAGGPWYEEDCDVAVVVAAFPEEFKPEQVKACKEMIKGDVGYFKIEL